MFHRYLLSYAPNIVYSQQNPNPAPTKEAKTKHIFAQKECTRKTQVVENAG